jgi:hypothetical protein
MKLRSTLYWAARGLRDYRTVHRATVDPSIVRRAAGKATSRLLRWLIPSILALALALTMSACGGGSEPAPSAAESTATAVR